MEQANLTAIASSPLMTQLSRFFSQQSETTAGQLEDCLTQQNTDPEFLHDLRVSTRRIAAFLDVFKTVLKPSPRKKLKAQLRELRRTTGRSRDLDVQIRFLEAVADHAGTFQRPGLQLYLTTIADRRAAQWEETTRKLTKLAPRLHRGISDFGKSLWDLAPAQSLEELAADTLPDAAREMIQRGNSLIRNPDRWHELRIAGKRCRYALEIFAPLLGDEFRKSLYPDFKDLQHVLGDLQDVSVGWHEFRKFRKNWKSRCLKAGGVGARARKEMDPGLNTIKLAYKNRRFEAAAKLRALWASFANSNLPGHLERLTLHALTDQSPATPDQAQKKTTQNSQR